MNGEHSRPDEMADANAHESPESDRNAVAKQSHAKPRATGLVWISLGLIIVGVVVFSGPETGCIYCLAHQWPMHLFIRLTATLLFLTPLLLYIKMNGRRGLKTVAVKVVAIAVIVLLDMIVFGVAVGNALWQLSNLK